MRVQEIEHFYSQLVGSREDSRIIDTPRKLSWRSEHSDEEGSLDSRQSHNLDENSPTKQQQHQYAAANNNFLADLGARRIQEVRS